MIQHKLGVETGVWRRFQNSSVEWAFAKTPEGEPIEELKDIINTLNMKDHCLRV